LRATQEGFWVLSQICIGHNYIPYVHIQCTSSIRVLPHQFATMGSPHYPHWQTGGGQKRGEKCESAVRWPCKCRARTRSKPESERTISLKCIFNSQAARDAQQPRPLRQQPVERRYLRRCELRTAEIDFERVCDEVRQGKSSQGSTCTGPRRKCVVADQEVDPHAAPNSSCTQRPSTYRIPT